MVRQAARADDSAARHALAELCRLYWFPLYAYVRGQGRAVAEAQDLTQEFFARLLARQDLVRADPARGKFRAFLLTALKHFLTDEWEKSRALKRGGPAEFPVDREDAERKLAESPADGLPPDRAFDRQWAITLLAAVLGRLESEYAAEGNHELFLALKGTLTTADEARPYAELAARTGLSEGAVKVAAHRLRRRYRDRLRAEIAETVATEDDARDELRRLLQALSGT